jgi:hypothetical protein
MAIYIVTVNVNKVSYGNEWAGAPKLFRRNIRE